MIWVSFVIYVCLSCSITVFLPLVNFPWGKYIFVFMILFFILYFFFLLFFYCAFIFLFLTWSSLFNILFYPGFEASVYK